MICLGEKEIKERWEEAYILPFKELPWEANRPEQELVRLIEEKKIKACKALDICCGAGTQSIYLAKKGFRVSGIDISDTAIRTAKQRAKKSKAKIKFLVGNAYDLKFRSSSFNFVFDRGCFQHIPPRFRKRYIAGISRVLVKKGKYLLLCFSDRNAWEAENIFSLKRIEDYFPDKFKILEAREVLHTQPDGLRVFLWSVLMLKLDSKNKKSKSSVQ